MHQPTGVGVGVLTTDRHLIVRTWNHWLAEATGIGEDRARGRRLGDLAGGPSAAWSSEIFADVIATGTPRVLAPAFHRFLIECPPREPSSHFDRMQQNVTVAPLRSGDEIVGLILTIEDVTARLETERRLAARLEEGASPGAALAAIGADDWRLRRDAVRALRRRATPADIEQLMTSLKQDHEHLGVLNSALQVLIAADLDVVGPLAELLGHGDPNVRMHAALALGELRSAAAVPALISSLEDGDANVRFHAIEALGRIGADDAVEPLAAIAASGDFFVAFAAIDALARIDDARVSGTLSALLDREEIRPAVVDALAALGDEDAVPPLVDLLNAGAHLVAPVAAALERIHARYEDTYSAGAFVAELVRTRLTPAGIAALASAVERRAGRSRPLVVVLGWAGPAAVPALVAALDDPEIQASVTAALVRCGSDAVEPLVAKVADGTRQERLAAAAVLGRLGDPRAIDPLLSMLRSVDADLVVAAAAAIAVVGDARALDELLSLFAHERASVRQAAVAAVNAIAAPRTAASVRVRFAAPDPWVRECAVRVAGYFAFADCVGAIVAATRDEREEVRRAALEQLPVLDDPRALPRLLEALASETPRNRAAAAHALRAVRDASAGPALARALADPDPWVRYFASGSIAHLGAIEAVPALVRASTGDPAPHVRIAALHALGALDVPDVVEVAITQIRDPDADLVNAAVSALAGASDPRVDRLLEDAITSVDPACRLSAARALAARASVSAVATLAWAARLEDPPELRAVAIDGLARLAGVDPGTKESDPVGAAAIGALLELADGSGRQEALSAIAGLARHAVPVIARELVSSRPAVRLAAVEALGRMGDRTASEALAAALDSADPAVRGAAITVFGRLGTTFVREAILHLRTSDPDGTVRRQADDLCRRRGWTGTA